MNSKTISILAAIIVVSMAIIFLSGRSKEAGDPLVGTPVFPDLKDMLAQVNRIDIGTGKGEVHLVSIDGLWVVNNRDDYPASFDKLSDLLDSLAGATVAEKKTGKPQYFDRLGLRDLDHEESQAVKVTIMTSAEEPLELLVGKAASNREGQYFRYPGEQQTWMMSRELDVETDAQDWLEPGIINIDSERIRKVTQTSAAGEQLTVVREGGEEENFSVVDLPVDKKLKYGTIANDLGRSLVNVRLKDAQKADGFDFSGGGKAEYWCGNGLEISVLTKEKDGQYYLGFSVEAGEAEEQSSVEEDSAEKESVGEASADEEQGDEKSSDKETPASAMESDHVTLAEEVEELSRALDSWVFEVTQYTFDDFTKKLDDLVEEEKEPVDSTDT